MNDMVFIPLERKDIYVRGEILDMSAPEIIHARTEYSDAAQRLIEDYLK